AERTRDRHDPLALELRACSDPGRRGDVAARGDPGEDALLAGEAAGPFEGLVVADLLDSGQERRVQVLGDEAGTDALDLVQAGLAAGDDRRCLGLDGDRLEGGVEAPD